MITCEAIAWWQNSQQARAIAKLISLQRIASEAITRYLASLHYD